MVKKLSILVFMTLFFYICCTRQGIGAAAYTAESDVEVFPQLGHSDWVTSVAFSPDGKTFVSGSRDKTIKLWDAATGREIRTFSGHYLGEVQSVAFSPDGKTLVSGAFFGDPIKLWDVVTGNEIPTLTDYSYGVNSVAFSPDGTTFVSGAWMEITLWDAATGSEIHTISDNSFMVESVAFSPDSKTVVSGLWDGTIKLWDATTGMETLTMSGHSKSVNSVAFSPDGKTLVSGSNDNTIKIWDVNTGREIHNLSGHSGGVCSVVFNPDGKTVVSGSFDKTIKFWDVITGTEIRNLSSHSSGVGSVAFSPDGKTLVSGAIEIKLWDAGTGSEIRTLSGHSNWVKSVAFSHDGKTVATGSNTTIKFWDVGTGRELRTLSGHYWWVDSVAFSSDGKTFVSGSGREIKLWDAGTGREIHTLSSSAIVESVAFSPDGKSVVSGSDDNMIKLWDAGTGSEIRTLSGHSNWVKSVAFSPDGKQILSGSWDGSVRLWDVITGREIHTLSGHLINVESVAFSPDGKTILSGAWWEEIKLWDAVTGSEIRNLSSHSDDVYSVAFNPDGKTFVSGSKNGTIYLWDVATGIEIHTLSGHSNTAYSIAFSPNGKTIVSGSRDTTTRIWDTATGKEIASLISFDDGEWIVITPDGYYNASPKGDEHLNVRIGNQVFGIDQFAAAFYQPEVVQARLQGKKDPVVVKLRGDIRQATVPPGVDIAVNNKDALTDTADLTVTIFDEFKAIQKTNIEITVNGRLLGEKELQNADVPRDITIAGTQLLASSKDRQLQFTIPVRLDSGLNYIEVIAANDYSYGSKRITLNAAETGTPQKGDLYVLAIGVNKYIKNKRQSGYADLERSASDAEKIINSFIEQGGEEKRYNHVDTLCLSDNKPIKPTKRKILESLEFLKKAKPLDTVVLFMSGHGKTDNGAYYFLPSDTVFTGNKSFQPQSAVNVEELVKALDIPGRKIVLLDTCESGGADVNRLVRTLKNRSTVVFTASQDGEYAYENGQYGGYFTHSITEGVNGKAASDGNEVFIKPLGEYITERVRDLNEETKTPLQHPMKYIPDGYHNFVVSRAD